MEMCNQFVYKTCFNVNNAFFYPYLQLPPTPQLPPHPSPTIPSHLNPKPHIRKVSLQLATRLTKTAGLDHSLSLITVFVFHKKQSYSKLLQFQAHKGFNNNTITWMWFYLGHQRQSQNAWTITVSPMIDFI